MSGAKHTPGPWKHSETYPGGDYCIHADGKPWQMAYTYGKCGPHGKWPAEANARLIAAAPDLLEALTSIRQYGSDTLSGRADGGPDDRTWQREAVLEMTRRARIAIEKAAGE